MIRKYVVLCSVAATAILMLGWGSVGHSLINDAAVIHLPPSLNGFVVNRSIIKSNASAADGRKGSDNILPYIAKETPRHFIDIDEPTVFPGFATRTIPHDLSVIIAQVNNDSSKLFATSNSVGVLPWAILWTMDTLGAQMKRSDWTKVWLTAADLGHYVGDLHQPLHVSKDYNGRASVSGSNGIHSRYESTMLSKPQSTISIVPATVQYIASPIDYIFDRVYETNELVDSIYNADILARQTAGSSSSDAYYTILWEKTGAMTRAQCQRASEMWASLIYTTWINAGSPPIPGAISSVASASGLPANVMLEQNYPNPFNPSTTITYRLKSEEHVRLAVYDLAGRCVAELVNGTASAGSHSVQFDAPAISSGVYFCTLKAGNVTTIRKMVLMR